MSPFSFRPAKRESVGLLIGLSGGTGSGKTFTALRLAKGIAAGRPFCVIDTEAGRAKHYADRFEFDHGDFLPAFTPDRYAEAIKAADDAKYPVIVVDSCSHEWAGEGGVLDMQEAELDRMSGNDYKKRDAVKMASWIKPKMSHKKMVMRLLQMRAHLILCFRAEPHVDMVRKPDGRMEVIPKKGLTGLDGWFPICEKSLPYELTASFLLMADKPGVPRPIKLEEQHRSLFPLDKPITEECGAALAAWARGGETPKADVRPPATPSTPPAAPATSSSDIDDWMTSIKDADTLERLDAVGKDIAQLPKAKRELLRDAYKGRRAALTPSGAGREVGADG